MRRNVIRCCAKLASALAFLHRHGVCVGDISAKNLLFSLTPHDAVYFIDCDAMRINGVSALPQVETPGWETPAGEELATIYSDAYKLGLLALRLLAGDRDTTNLRHIPSTTPEPLRQIITDTLYQCAPSTSAARSLDLPPSATPSNRPNTRRRRRRRLQHRSVRLLHHRHRLCIPDYRSARRHQ